MADDGDKDKDKEPEKPPDRDQAYADQLTKDAERIREAAKWLVAGFGAVAAALITGIQLSDLGETKGDDRTLALIAAAVGMLAVVVALISAAAILTGGRGNLPYLLRKQRKNWPGKTIDWIRFSHRRQIKAELEDYKQLFGPYGNLKDFVRGTTAAWDDQTRSWLASINATDPAVKATELAKLKRATDILAGLNPLVARARALAGYLDVRLRFNKLRWVIGISALLAGTSMAVFAIASHPEDEPAPIAVVSQPVRATVDLNERGVDQFSDTLGEKCDMDALPVVVLKSGKSGWEVVSDSDDASCAVTRMNVSRDQGTVSGESVVLTPPEL